MQESERQRLERAEEAQMAQIRAVVVDPELAGRPAIRGASAPLPAPSEAAVLHVSD